MTLRGASRAFLEVWLTSCNAEWGRDPSPPFREVRNMWALGGLAAVGIVADCHLVWTLALN